MKMYAFPFIPVNDYDGPYELDETGERRQPEAVGLAFPRNQALIRELGAMRREISERDGNRVPALGWSPQSGCWWVRIERWTEVYYLLRASGHTFYGPLANPDKCLRRLQMKGM